MQDNGTLKPKNKGDIKAPIGDLREGGISVTRFPALYVKGNNCFLDTQGFFDLRDDREMNIASSILMEMAVNKAKSVRIVNLCKCDNFINGLANFHSFGEQLSKIITCDYEPIYFLFNRYNIPAKLVSKYASMKESEKNDRIHETLKESYKYYENGRRNLIKNAIKKILNTIMNNEKEEEEEIQDIDLEQIMNGKDLSYIIERCDDASSLIQKIDIQNEIYQLNEKYKYISFITESFKKGYFGYIDPESQESLGDFLERISKFPAIDKRHLSFNGMTTERNYFNQFFESEIANEINFMQKIKFITIYKDENIDELIIQIKNDIQRNKEFQNDIFDISDENLDKVLLEFKNELCQLIEMKKTYEDHLQHLEKSLEEFENAPAEPFWDDSWDLEPGILLWRNYICKYNENIPFVSYNEILDEITSPKRRNIQKPTHFEVEYSSKSNVKYIVFRILKDIRKLFTEFKTNRCKGKVTLFAYKKDIEPKTIPLMKNEIEEIKSQIKDITETINQYNSLFKEQSQQSKYMVLIKKNQLKKINEYRPIIDQVRNQWHNDDSKRNLWRKYNNIIQALYINRSNESINKFNDLYQIITGSVQSKPKCSFHLFRSNFKLSFPEYCDKNNS